MGPEKPPAVDDHNQSEVKKLNGHPESGVVQVWPVESRFKKEPDSQLTWVSVVVCPGPLHQSEREEECLSEHSEPGCLAQGVLHHFLKRARDPFSDTRVCVWTRTRTLYRYQTCLHLGSSSAPPAVNWPSDLSLLHTLTGWKQPKKRAEISPDLPSLWPFVCL